MTPDVAAARELYDHCLLSSSITRAVDMILAYGAAQRAAGAAEERARCGEIVETAIKEARRRIDQAIKDDDADIWIELLRATARFGDDLLDAMQDPLRPTALGAGAHGGDTQRRESAALDSSTIRAQPGAPPEGPR